MKNPSEKFFSFLSSAYNFIHSTFQNKNEKNVDGLARKNHCVKAIQKKKKCKEWH